MAIYINHTSWSEKLTACINVHRLHGCHKYSTNTCIVNVATLWQYYDITSLPYPTPHTEIQYLYSNGNFYNRDLLYKHICHIMDI